MPGPAPRSSAEPVRVQRRVSATDVIMIAGKNTALGRSHAGQILLAARERSSIATSATATTAMPVAMRNDSR
jgi:hypothetical protein